MRSVLAVSLIALLSACASVDPELWELPPGMSWESELARKGELRVAIQSPYTDLELRHWESSLEVKGGASVFGGVEYLDLVLVLDSSQSLRSTDPEDHRAAGAVRLVRSLPDRGDMRVGVVDFDSKASLVLPLTADRDAAVEAIEGLDRDGTTDIAAGIRTALVELDRDPRINSTRVIMLFTDGKSHARRAHEAMLETRQSGVVVHTILLGASEAGETILRGVAAGTGGSFVGVVDPERLPEAFMNLRTTGVERVTLQVNGAAPLPARMVGGTFSRRVPLRPGENRIVATATSLSGETSEAAVSVTVSGEMALRIVSPIEGTVLGRRDSEVVVEGDVDAFVGLPAEFEGAWPKLEVDSVMLRVDGSPPQQAALANGHFAGTLQLSEGEHRVRVVATSLDGRSARESVMVSVRPDGCSELQVTALADGQPTLSISDRAVAMVVDASNSMWGQLDGTPKISIAKQILDEALNALPPDLRLSLRVYGHRHPRELRNCTDSELLVPLRADNRSAVREAIASFRPRGQTPLAYSLGQVAADFGDFAGERAVALVTDGIESCGGDPIEVARELAQRDTVVHVIGFGLGNAADEDADRLEAIATASGGRYFTAQSGEELRGALAVTVGTAFEVLRDDEVVGEGALGANEQILLPEGRYRLRLDSKPPQDVELELVAEKSVTLSFEREGGDVSHVLSNGSIEYTRCEDMDPAPPAADAWEY